MSFLLWGQPKSSFPSSLSSKASVVFLVDFMNYVVWSLNFCLMSPEKVNGLLGAWFLGGFVSLVLFDLFFQSSFKICSYFSPCIFTRVIFPRAVFLEFCLVPALLLQFPLWYFRLLGKAELIFSIQV